MLYLISAPVSEGRPQEEMLDMVAEAAVRAVPQEQVQVWRPQSRGAANGVYDEGLADEWAYHVARKLGEVLQPGDRVLLIEYFMPAVMQVMVSSVGRSCEWFGIVHANCFTPGDFTFNVPAFMAVEQALERGMHLIVATRYMASLLPYAETKKVHVTGLPIRLAKIADRYMRQAEPGVCRVVFPHRWIPEKSPWKFVQLAEAARMDPQLSSAEFVVLSASDKVIREVAQHWAIRGVLCRTKDEYYSELATGTVLFADSEIETYGYSVREAAILGLELLLNRHPVYLEQFEAKYHDGTVENMLEALRDPRKVSGMLSRPDLTAADAIVNVILYQGENAL